jgi:peptidoglycan-associated lipoprotein
MRHTYLLITLATVSLITAGCHNKQTPSASDTVLRSSYSDSSNPNADNAAGSNVNGDSLAAQGLEARDQNFGSISADNLERGTLPSIYFDFDRATIKPAERAKLQQAAEYLKTNAARKALIEGHCDWRGTAEYNLGLGDSRARAAKEYLQSLGIDANRIGTVSKGDLEATKNGTEEQMAQDRRDDLLLLKQ